MFTEEAMSQHTVSQSLDTVVSLIPEAMDVAQSNLIKTEIRELGWLVPYSGRQVITKLETQQITGSFKSRGALFCISRRHGRAGIIAPSAGNHGLAVAWAAARLGLPADIVLPQNASPLKRERILSLGAGIIEAGSTVEDATETARALAEGTDRCYVSPYNDPAVIAGQATAVVEMLTSRPDIGVLIIPVGGGGLLSGAIAAREYLGMSVPILACEPIEFASMSRCLESGDYVHLGRRPTFADGLATNIEQDSITFDIVSAAPDVIFCAVSEEEIAASCTALFNRESILAEGAAGAGIAASLHIRDLGLPEGIAGTILCGGNVHHTTFWQMAAFPFTDPTLVALADTLGRRVSDEPPRRQLLGAVNAIPMPDRPAGGRGMDLGLPAEFIRSLDDYTVKTRLMLDDLAHLACTNHLPLDQSMLSLVREINETINAHVHRSAQAGPAEREQRARVLSQFAAAARLSFEWRSPGYDQSAALTCFDLGALGSSGVNYARYDQPGATHVERQLAELLRVPTDTHTVLITASGMAAFALAATTIMSAGPFESALTAPYLYFEGMEMLQYWLGGKVTVAESYDADSIAAQAGGVDTVFADPLSNHPDQRMIDVELLARRLASEPVPPWLVVDGTMLPVATARPVITAMPDKAIYYESCSKYLQFGLDIVMAGLVVVPRTLEPLARRVRRNLGLGLDRYGAELFPRYQPDSFEDRLSLMERSALQVATALRETLSTDLFTVVYPGLPDHPDYLLAAKFARQGSCVTLAPTTMQLGRDQLDPVVDGAIHEARRRRLPLVKGLSFGFSTSRLSAASAMAESAPPFLRLAVGPLAPRTAGELADALRCAVEHAAATWPRNAVG
jgi:threonine dehydratase